MRSFVVFIVLTLCLGCTGHTPPIEPTPTPTGEPSGAEVDLRPSLPVVAVPDAIAPADLVIDRREAAAKSHVRELMTGPAARTATLARMYQFAGMPLIDEAGQVVSIAEVGSGLAVTPHDVWFQAHAPRSSRIRLMDLAGLILDVTGAGQERADEVTRMLIADLAKGLTSSYGPRRYLAAFVAAETSDRRLEASSPIHYDSVNLLLRAIADDLALAAASAADADTMPARSAAPRPRKHPRPSSDLGTFRTPDPPARGSPCTLTDSEYLILRSAGEVVSRALRGQDWVPIPSSDKPMEWADGKRPKRLPGVLDVLNKALGGGDESGLMKWRRYSGIAQYLADAGRLIALITSLQAETTMLGKTELVRTQTTKSAGDRVVLNTRIWYDFGDLTWFNCFTFALATAGVRLAIPPNGPLSGVDVNYIGTQGFAFEMGQRTDAERARVGFFTVPGGPRPDRQQSNPQGLARIGVTGLVQRFELPAVPEPERHRFGLRVWVALTPDSMGKDLWDAFGNATRGTAWEAIIQGILNLAQRSSILVEQPSFPLVDWFTQRTFDFALDYDRTVGPMGTTIHIEGIIRIDDAARARGERGIVEQLTGYHFISSHGQECSRVYFVAKMPSATMSPDGLTIKADNITFSTDKPTVCADGYASRGDRYPGDTATLTMKLPTKPGESVKSRCYFTCVITITRR